MNDKRACVSLTGEGKYLLNKAKERWGGDGNRSAAAIVTSALKEKLSGMRSADQVLRTLLLQTRVIADELYAEPDVIWLLEWFNITLQRVLSPRIKPSVVREILTRAGEEITSKMEPIPDYYLDGEDE